MLNSGLKLGAWDMTELNPDDLLTTAEAALLIGISLRRVQRLCADGDIPNQQIGKRTRLIRRVDAEAYRDGYRKPGPKPSTR